MKIIVKSPTKETPKLSAIVATDLLFPNRLQNKVREGQHCFLQCCPSSECAVQYVQMYIFVMQCKKPDCHAPEELFDAFLNTVFVA